jgi:hypothetical protein
VAGWADADLGHIEDDELLQANRKQLEDQQTSNAAHQQSYSTSA